MKKHGILNSHISKVLTDLGHTDTIVIADCGLPIPDGVARIDLALELGTPSFLDVVRVVAGDMAIEQLTLATEIKEANPDVLEQLKPCRSRRRSSRMRSSRNRHSRRRSSSGPEKRHRTQMSSSIPA